MIENIIKGLLVPENDYVFGTAYLEGLTNEIDGRYKNAIVIGRRISREILSGMTDHPTKEYYSHFKKINIELSLLSTALDIELRKLGITILKIRPSLSSQELDTVYSGTLTAPFSHKMAATRAGIGWIGKSGLLINREFGPALRLVTLLTDYKLSPSGKPVIRSSCGSCNKCVDACPAKAITGKSWNIFVSREELIDPFKCRSMCHEMGKIYLSPNARACGICVAVCPAGKRS